MVFVFFSALNCYTIPPFFFGVKNFGIPHVLFKRSAWEGSFGFFFLEQLNLRITPNHGFMKPRY